MPAELASSSSLVPGVVHFNQALLGHSCQAPKGKAVPSLFRRFEHDRASCRESRCGHDADHRERQQHQSQQADAAGAIFVDQYAATEHADGLCDRHDAEKADGTGARLPTARLESSAPAIAIMGIADMVSRR